MTTTGAIYDRGYRPYEGIRLGRNGARRGLFLASVRRALGFRRSWRQKVTPWVLLAISTTPAIVFIGIGYVTRNTDADFEIVTYQDYVGISTVLLLFVAHTAPDVMCPDRRHRMLSIIFARPLTGIDYALTKVASIFAITFAFALIPQLILYVGQIAVDKSPLDYALDNASVLWKSPLAVLVLTYFLSVLGVACASLTKNRIVGGALFIGFMLFTSAIAGIVLAASGGEGTGALLNFIGLPLYLRDIIFEGQINTGSPLSGVPGGGVLALITYLIVTSSALGVVLARYRKVDV